MTLAGESFGSEWTSSENPSNPYSFCGSYLLLGGISIGVANSVFTYTVANLPVHTTVFINFNLFIIDQNPQNVYQYGIRIDQQNIINQ